jgi:hypothetical protein
VPSADDEPALRAAGCRTGRAAPSRFPRSPPPGRRVSRPAVPWQHRHPYAAVLQDGLPADTFSRLRSRPRHPYAEARTAFRPRSARFRAGGRVTGLQLLVPLVRRLVSLAGPAPSGSTDTSRRCQGRLPPPRTPLQVGCPQLHQPAATGWRRGPFTPAGNHGGASWRTNVFFQVAAAFCFSLCAMLIVASKSTRSPAPGSGAARASQARFGAAARGARTAPDAAHRSGPAAATPSPSRPPAQTGPPGRAARRSRSHGPPPSAIATTGRMLVRGPATSMTAGATHRSVPVSSSYQASSRSRRPFISGQASTATVSAARSDTAWIRSSPPHT